MARKRHIRWDRVFMVFGPVLLLILLLCVCCKDREPSEDSSLVIQTLENKPTIPLQTTADSQAVPALNTEIHEYTVVIDPGHGGNDDGAVNTAIGRKEKDDNLRLALAVRGPPLSLMWFLAREAGRYRHAFSGRDRFFPVEVSDSRSRRIFPALRSPDGFFFLGYHSRGTLDAPSRLEGKEQGGHSVRVPPLPIPNREVKPHHADGTAKVGE